VTRAADGHGAGQGQTLSTSTTPPESGSMAAAVGQGQGRGRHRFGPVGIGTMGTPALMRVPLDRHMDQVAVDPHTPTGAAWPEPDRYPPMDKLVNSTRSRYFVDNHSPRHRGDDSEPTAGPQRRRSPLTRILSPAVQRHDAAHFGDILPGHRSLAVRISVSVSRRLLPPRSWRGRRRDLMVHGEG
jgi:hypothetical protein